MKIALLIPTLSRGGAEKVASELSYLLPKSWEVVFILFEKKVVYPYRGKVVSLDLPLEKNLIRDISNFFLRILKTRRVVKNEKIDIVISFDDYANMLNVLCTENSILSVHKSLVMADMNKSFLKKTFASFLRKILYNRSRKIITVSEGIKTELIEYANVNKNKVVTIYNPYRIQEIMKNSRKKPEVELPNNFVLNIGRAERQKGQWHLIRAFSKVNNYCPGLKLVIIGNGSLLPYLRNLAHSLGLDDSIIFIEKFVNIAPIIKRAKMLVLSSIFEGFPNVIVESMILGTPVISTDCKTGPREILGSGVKKNGFEITRYGVLTPRLDGKLKKYNEPLTEEESKLADAIIFLYKNKKLRKKLSMNAKKRAKDFDAKIAREKYIKLIEKVVRTSN